MDDAYNKIKNAGKNTTDGVVEIMKNAKIIDNVRLSEEKVRDIFSIVGTKATEQIDLDKFRAGIYKVGETTKETGDQIIKRLMEIVQNTASQAATGVGNAAKAGVNALKDAFK